jgi:hypothetical protein
LEGNKNSEAHGLIWTSGVKGIMQIIPQSPYLYKVNFLKKYLFAILIILFASGAKYFPIDHYNLDSPDKIFVLPDTLREVSGCAFLDTASFACIQDENGILFIYDLSKNQIKKQYNFHIDGDYEGVTNVDETIYILRSDGTLFEISDYNSPKFKVKTHVTGISAPDNEGLCYDKTNNRLLIASKGKIGKGPELKNKRLIYAFDLSSNKLSAIPAFDFNLENIKQFALSKKIPLPTRSKKNGVEPVLKFNTSAICIHPLTNELYLLSASEHLLFIFDMKGEIRDLVMLDPKIFNKPEGITFNKKGEMLITNEGQDKTPTALLFEFRK